MRDWDLRVSNNEFELQLDNEVFNIHYDINGNTRVDMTAKDIIDGQFTAEFYSTENALRHVETLMRQDAEIGMENSIIQRIFSGTGSTVNEEQCATEHINYLIENGVVDKDDTDGIKHLMECAVAFYKKQFKQNSKELKERLLLEKVKRHTLPQLFTHGKFVSLYGDENMKKIKEKKRVLTPNSLSPLVNTNDKDFPFKYKVPIVNDEVELFTQQQLYQLHVYCAIPQYFILDLLNTFFDIPTVLTQENMFVAGGAITSIYHNEHPHDIDIFFQNLSMSSKQMAGFTEDSMSINSFLNGYNDLVDFSVSKNCISFTYCVRYNDDNEVFNENIKYQLVFGETDISKEEIISKFDYVHTQAMYFPCEKKLICNEYIGKHIANKVLERASLQNDNFLSIKRILGFLSDGFCTPHIKPLIQDACKSILSQLMQPPLHESISDLNDRPYINTSSNMYVFFVNTLQNAINGTIELEILLKLEKTLLCGRKYHTFMKGRNNEY